MSGRPGGERPALSSIEQLPEIETVGAGPDAPIELELEVVEDEREEPWFSFTLGEREIWREPAEFESMPRYAELLAMLRQRYAPRQVTVEVSDRAQRWLYGGRSWTMPR